MEGDIAKKNEVGMAKVEEELEGELNANEKEKQEMEN